MKRIILLDPSVGSTNLGDEILLRCARRELESVFHADCFFIPLPTHLQAFRLTDKIPPRPVLVEEIRNADYRFVCGTNLLSESLLRRTSPWHLNRPTAEILRGSILMGAGGAVPGADSRGFAAAYTKKLYRTVLSDRYIHSVRTSPTLQSMQGLAGIRALQTGCFSQWMLTPDFCRGIHTEKADTVVHAHGLRARPEGRPHDALGSAQELQPTRLLPAGAVRHGLSAQPRQHRRHGHPARDRRRV